MLLAFIAVVVGLVLLIWSAEKFIDGAAATSRWLGLSPLLVQEIFAIVRRLNKEQGVTLLLVEQNAQVALNTADHGYVLETGRIVMDGSAEALLASDDIREFYLGQSAGDDRPEKRWKRKKTWR